MDIGAHQVGPAKKKDEVGDRVQKLFQDFLSELVAYLKKNSLLQVKGILSDWATFIYLQSRYSRDYYL